MPSPAVPSAPPVAPPTPAALDEGAFRLLFEALPGLHLVLRADGPHYTVAAATDAYLAATHARREHVVGRPLFEAFADANPANLTPTGVANLRASLERVVRTGREHRMAVQRYDVRSDDGQWLERYWAPCNRPLRDESGHLALILHTVEDVSEQMTQRHAAERAEDLLQAVFAQAPVAVAVTEGPEHRYVLANAAYEQVSGRPPGELLGRTAREVFPELTDAPLFALADRAYATGQPTHLDEVRTAVVRDGVVEHGVFNAVFQPLRDAAERVTGIVVVATDVSAPVEARAAVDAASRQLALFAALTEHSNDAQYLLDEQGRVRWVNRLGCERLGYTRAELLALDVSAYEPGILVAEFAQYFARPRRGRVPPFEGVHRRKDGTEFPVEITVTVVELPEGARMLAAVRDISERKREEAERERLVRELAAANQAKSQFLAVMSHELRTPLNAIAGYVELIELGLRGPVTPEQREDLSRVRRSQRHLLGLINGVLNYAKLEAGAVAYAMEEVALDEVLAECEALVAPQVGARGLRLVYGGCDTPDGSARARADKEKVRQVVLNLLSNAVKFTPRGGRVTVSCAAAGDQVHLCVADTGAGIAPRDLARVFEPFVQVDARLSRAEEGTGLGLAISRDLARGMGGDLTVESTPGAGSRFTLVLPPAEAVTARVGRGG